MIIGIVKSGEGRIRLTVKGLRGREQEIDAIVDTINWKEADTHRASSMLHLSLQEAEQLFPQLFTAARAGEAVEIHDAGWIYRLTATGPRPRPPVTGTPLAGRPKGKLSVPDDFDEPLEELREYER